MKNTQTISIVLQPADKIVVGRLLKALEVKFGFRMPITQLTRYAYAELDKQLSKKTA